MKASHLARPGDLQPHGRFSPATRHKATLFQFDPAFTTCNPAAPYRRPNRSLKARPSRRLRLPFRSSSASSSGSAWLSSGAVGISSTSSLIVKVLDSNIRGVIFDVDRECRAFARERGEHCCSVGRENRTHVYNHERIFLMLDRKTQSANAREGVLPRLDWLPGKRHDRVQQVVDRALRT